MSVQLIRYAVERLVETLRYKPEGRGFHSLVAEWFKARVCGRLFAGVTGSLPAEGMGVCVVSKQKRENAGQSRKRNKYG